MESRGLNALRVLIIDEREKHRLALKNQLQSVADWSLTVDQAADGKTALEKMKSAPADLLFLEFKLRESDGLAVLAQLRQSYPKSAVVMVTDAGSETVAVAAMKHGAIDYLTHEELRALDMRQLFRRVGETRKLLTQNRELRQINQMKNEFISNVSHELRTPLSVILGYAQSLKEGGLGPLRPEQNKALEAIIQRAEALLRNLNGILEFRQAEEGRRRLLLKPLELGRWLGERLNRPPKGLAKKKMRLDCSGIEKPAWVNADEAALAEALDNLLSNAMKFGPESGSIGLRLKAGKGEARITVEDAGPGISPERLPHLFERMFTADRHPERESSGLGLGLALTRQIVELHSGRVWLESKGSGKGCTATIALPLTSPEGPEILAGGAPEIKKRRILIVEDNEDLVEVLMLFLSTLSPNLEIASTASGFAALESIKEVIPHLIILDVMMPGMSGLEVIERLRRLPETQRVPVLVLTGYPEGAQMALASGAKDVLLKPFEKNAFTDKVMRLLQRETGER